VTDNLLTAAWTTVKPSTFFYVQRIIASDVFSNISTSQLTHLVFCCMIYLCQVLCVLFDHPCLSVL